MRLTQQGAPGTQTMFAVVTSASLVPVARSPPSMCQWPGMCTRRCRFTSGGAAAGSLVWVVSVPCGRFGAARRLAAHPAQLGLAAAGVGRPRR